MKESSTIAKNWSASPMTKGPKVTSIISSEHHDTNQAPSPNSHQSISLLDVSHFHLNCLYVLHCSWMGFNPLGMLLLRAFRSQTTWCRQFGIDNSFQCVPMSITTAINPTFIYANIFLSIQLLV